MYFEMSIDKSEKQYWYLADLHYENGNVADELAFKRGILYKGKETLIYNIKEDGMPAMFHFAGAFIPVVTEKIKNELFEIERNSIQFVPVKVEKQDKKYFIINVLEICDCIDMVNSQYIEFNQPPLPKYSFYKLILEESKIKSHIIRPKNWTTAFIVSNTIKNALVKFNMDGIIFKKVTL